MNIDKATPEQYQDIKRRIYKGFGELVSVDWTDLEEQEVTLRDEEGTVILDDEGNPRRETVYNPVKRTNTYYVGKMTMDQTGDVLAAIAGIFMDAEDLLKQAEGSGAIFLLIQKLSSDALYLLTSTITGEDPHWIEENWDLKWVIPMLTTFFKREYNPFLELWQTFRDQTSQKMGVDLGQIMALAQARVGSQQAPTVRASEAKS